MWVQRRVQKSVRLYLVGVCVDPTTSPSVMSFDAQFCHNLPINVRQMQRNASVCRAGRPQRSGSAQAMR